MRFILGILIFCLSVFALFLFEGICFRMVEKYAIFRLESSWGEKKSENIHKYLKILPLSHFAKTPSNNSEVEFSLFKALEEDKYACEIMRFGRPQRDHFIDFINDLEPLRKSYRIIDINHIRGLILPGLKRFPTDEEVAKGWAGRQRDQMEYAKALFVDIKPSPLSLEKSVSEQRNYDFFLKQGIACLSLPARSKDSLLNDLRLLKKTYPAVCQKIICRAYGREAEILLTSCSNNPFLVNMIIVDSPSGYAEAPQVESAPWFYCTLGEGELKNMALVDGLLGWVAASRDSHYVYPSKIGGLMRIRDNFSTQSLVSFHVPLIRECISFYESLEKDKLRSFAIKEAARIEPTFKSQPKVSISEEIPDQLDFSTISTLQAELPKIETENSQAFDCKMVREYRALHADDPSVSLANNRELILKIGTYFEQMGEDMLLEVGEKDPLFFQFYQSLKIIEAQSVESYKYPK